MSRINLPVALCNHLQSINHPYKFFHPKLDITILPLKGDELPSDMATNKAWEYYIPKNASKEPENNSIVDRFYALGLIKCFGSSGYNWVDLLTEYVVFEIDSISGHGEGLSDEKLADAFTKFQALPYVRCFYSKGGKGIHIYVFFKTPLPSPNRAVHLTWRKAMFAKMCADSGQRLGLLADRRQAGNAWVYAHNAADNAFTPVDPQRGEVFFEGTLELPQKTERKKKETITVVNRKDFDVADWLESQPWQGSWGEFEGKKCFRFSNPTCPFRPSEKDGGAMLVLHGDSLITVHCHHHACGEQANVWQQLWELGDGVGEAPCSVREEIDDPDRLAREVIAATQVDGAATFAMVKDRPYLYRNGRWERASKVAWLTTIRRVIRQDFIRNAKGVVKKISRELCHNVQLALLQQLGDKYDTKQDGPFWFDDRPINPKQCIQLQNVIVHVPEYATARQAIQQGKLTTEGDSLPGVFTLTPLFFCTNFADYRFDPNAKEPTTFLKALNDWFPNDKASCDLVQEHLGDSLAPSGQQDKFLILQGPGGTGKTTFMNIGDRLVGREAAKSIDASQLDSRFGLSAAVGKKRLNFREGDEDNPRLRKNLFTFLKGITGRDPQDIEWKNDNNRVDLSPEFCISVSINGGINAPDKGGSILRRLLVLLFTYVIDDTPRENIDLENQIDLAALFNWACDGYHRLHAIGRFTRNEATHNARKDFELANESVRAWMFATVHRLDGGWVPVDRVHKSYTEWETEHGIAIGNKDDLNKVSHNFWKELQIAAPWVRRKQIRSGGDKFYVYEGLQFDADLDAADTPDNHDIYRQLGRQRLMKSKKAKTHKTPLTV